MPGGEDAALRDVGRARAEARTDGQAAQGRRKALLLRPDSRSAGRAHQGPAPLRWLAEVVGPPPAQQSVFQEQVRAGAEHTERVPRLEAALQTQGQSWRGAPGVAASQAVRGGQCTGAVTRSAALGALRRCATPRQLLSSLGLPPSAHPRGERRRPGALTQTGTSPARRALIEGAWAQRDPAQVSRPRQRRWETVPKVSQDMSGQAQVRLGKRSRRWVARGQHVNQVVVAIARAMAAFLWAIAREGEVTH